LRPGVQRASKRLDLVNARSELAFDDALNLARRDIRVLSEQPILRSVRLLIRVTEIAKAGDILSQMFA
jgi:hypothetical protein